jgi:hypothetical protein
VKGEADLLHVVGALDSASGLAGGLNCRQQERDQHRDDGDHDEKFDQGETSPTHQ